MSDLLNDRKFILIFTEPCHGCLNHILPSLECKKKCMKRIVWEQDVAIYNGEESVLDLPVSSGDI